MSILGFDLNIFNKLSFASSRLLNGLIIYGIGVISIVEPYLVMKYLGHYPVPENFGWDWYDPEAMDPSDLDGDEYDRWENSWVLTWNCIIGATQIALGVLNVSSIPGGILHVWDIFGL